MKKSLLIAVLILAVLTSLTAGTLASYNQTLNVTGAAHSLKFDFLTSPVQGFNQPLKIAPGKTVEYTFNVGQDMEVPVTYTITPTFSGPYSLRKKLTATVIDITGGREDGASGSTLTFNAPPMEKTYNFKVVVKWDDTGDNAGDVAANNQDVTMNVAVTGVAP